MQAGGIKKFTTHRGDVVRGAELRRALAAVADAWAGLGRRIREEDAYAAHVTENEKDAALAATLAAAERVRAGYVEDWTIAQRLDAELTGECVPLLTPAADARTNLATLAAIALVRCVRERP